MEMKQDRPKGLSTERKKKQQQQQKITMVMVTILRIGTCVCDPSG